MLRQELVDHKMVCDARYGEHTALLSELVLCTRQNTDAVTRLADETHGVVQLHKDMQGAARIGVNVQKIITWVIKWPLIGGGALALYEWASKFAP